MVTQWAFGVGRRYLGLFCVSVQDFAYKSDSVDNNNKHRNIALIPKWITQLCLAYLFLGSTKKNWHRLQLLLTSPKSGWITSADAVVNFDPNVLTACLLCHCYPCFVIKQGFIPYTYHK